MRSNGEGFWGAARCAKRERQNGHPCVIEDDSSRTHDLGQGKYYLRELTNVCPSLLEAKETVTPDASMYEATPQAVAGCSLRVTRKSWTTWAPNSANCGSNTERGNIDCAPGQRAIAGATMLMEATVISRL